MRTATRMYERMNECHKRHMQCLKRAFDLSKLTSGVFRCLCLGRIHWDAVASKRKCDWVSSFDDLLFERMEYNGLTSSRMYMLRTPKTSSEEADQSFPNYNFVLVKSKELIHLHASLV